MYLGMERKRIAGFLSQIVLKSSAPLFAFSHFPFPEDEFGIWKKKPGMEEDTLHLYLGTSVHRHKKRSELALDTRRVRWVQRLHRGHWYYSHHTHTHTIGHFLFYLLLLLCCTALSLVGGVIRNGFHISFLFLFGPSPCPAQPERRLSFCPISLSLLPPPSP